MSLIARASSSETAATLLARLQALGVEIETGRNTSTTLAYSANGLVLRQKETVVTTQYVGLTKEAAQKLEELDDDQTASAVYYKQIGTTGDYAAVTLTTGTVTDYASSRADEGGSWAVTKTAKTYAAANDTGWSTTSPSASTPVGVVTSKDSRKTYVWEYGGDAIYAVETTTVTEYRYVTKAQADALVASNTSCNATLTRYDHGLAYSYVQAGTNKTASARYVDATSGWTVTVTQTDYSAEGTGWSAA